MKAFTLCLILLLLLSPVVSAQGTGTEDDIKPIILAHFMPWNVAPPIASEWGWHWTMNHYNPDKVDRHDRREIASHYYPLTGPYDSMDPDIMEYQVLLMKLSGIDGIIVDWYGTGNLWDYPGINARTNAMFEAIDKAGLQFSICYEDQVFPNLIRQKVIEEHEKYEQGKRDLSYLEQMWFSHDAYVKLDNKPVLLNFGPQFFRKSSEWEEIFSTLSNPLVFFTEDNRIAPAAVGAFSWPPMWKTPSDGILTQASLEQYLNEFSSKSAKWAKRVSSAFPAFHDIYRDAGVSNGYGFLDPNSGSTFRLTLEHAFADKPHIIQLVTWNDYGEGTIIEPTEEFRYQYLEIVQEFRRRFIDADFQPQPRHLLLPLQVFRLRKDFPYQQQLTANLDSVFELLSDMKLDAAESLLITSAPQRRPRR